ncbi:MAG: DUF2339 domain-containing protein [Thermoanaerobaculia bacterium]
MFEFIVIIVAIVLLVRLSGMSGRIRALEDYNVELRRWLDETLAAQGRTAAQESQPDSAEQREAPPSVAEDPFLRTTAQAAEEKILSHEQEASAEVAEDPFLRTTAREAEEKILSHEPEPEMFPAAARAEVAEDPFLRSTSQAAEEKILSHKRPFDFENLVGVRLFSWLAGIALVFAAIFFLRYSIESGWMTPPVRAAIGLATGLGLLAFTSWRFSRDYPVTANALEGAAVAILYSTVWASSVMWALIGTWTAVAAMAIVTVIAVVLSIRRDSLFIALLGMLGGFATPVLFAAGEDRTVALFTYLLILNGGLAWTAYRRRWPSLMAVSMVFTTLYQVAWTANFLDSSRLPIAAGIFLAFPALLAVVHLVSTRRDSPSPVHGRVLAFAGIVPLLFAVYSATVPDFGSRFHLLFAFLLIAVSGLAVLSVKSRDEVTGGIPAVATLVVFAVWFARGWVPEAWPAVLIWIAVFVALFAFGPLLLRRLGDNALIERSTITAPLLLFTFSALIVREPETRSPLLLFTAAGILFVLCAVSAHLSGRASDFSTGALALLVAQAFWSAEHLEAANVAHAAILYGAFALLVLVIGAVARRSGKDEASSQAPWLILGSFFLALFLVRGSLFEAAFPVLATLLLLLLIAAAAESVRARLPLLYRAATAIAFLLLAVALVQRPPHDLIESTVALAAAVGLGALATAAVGRWRERKVWGATTPATIENAYFATGAFLFLFAAVINPELPSPLRAVLPALAIVTVAFTAAAFHFRRLSMHALGVIAALIVLIAWEVTRFRTDSMAGPVLSAAGLAILAIGAMLMARRLMAPAGERFAFDDVELGGWISVAFIPALALMLMAGSAIAAPRTLSAASLGALLAIPAFALTIIAALARWHAAALLTVASGALALFIFREAGDLAANDPVVLAVASLHYLVFTLYGFHFALRSAREHRAQLVAAAASVPFFFLFRDAFEASRLDGIIGIVPLAIAAILLLLLTRVPREGEGADGNLGTRALLAGAVLAYATVAIPLQLDNEWLTLGWALEGAALAWLYTRIPHRNLPYWAAGLFAAVFVRLVLNPAVFDYHPRSGTPVLNWYLYTYLVAAAAFFAGGWLWRYVEKEHPLSALRPLLNGAGTLLLFLLLNIEIADFYSVGHALTFNFFTSSLAQELTYTLGWAVFAIGLLVAGILLDVRGARIAAIALLSVTVFKGFLHDLSRLGGLYRVASFVGLAISLSIVAVLLQRFALRRDRRDPSIASSV